MSTFDTGNPAYVKTEGLLYLLYKFRFKSVTSDVPHIDEVIAFIKRRS